MYWSTGVKPFIGFIIVTVGLGQGFVYPIVTVLLWVPQLLVTVAVITLFPSVKS